MNIIRTTGSHLQTLLGESLDPIGRQTGLIQRQRKFTASTLLKTLIFTILKYPAARPEQYAWTAAKFGVIVTPEAIQKRFSSQLVAFLREVLKIELLFKLWKSHSQLDKHQASRPAIWQMAELLAKLIGVVIQHWLLLSLTWTNPRRSLRKAAGILRDRVEDLRGSLNDLDRLTHVFEELTVAIEAFAKVKLKHVHPSSFQLLANPELLDYTS